MKEKQNKSIEGMMRERQRGRERERERETESTTSASITATLLKQIRKDPPPPYNTF